MDIRRGLVYNRVEQRDFLRGGRRMSKVYRTAHTVYCLNYHFVWVPKYRRDVLTGYVAERAKEIFCEIAERYEFKVEAVNIGGDHVHIFLSAPPRYSPARIVNIMKSISAKKLFEEFPRVKEKLWGGKFWARGYYVGSSGEDVTDAVIKRYIKYHQDARQLKLL
jgi:putative transposase